MTNDATKVSGSKSAAQTALNAMLTAMVSREAVRGDSATAKAVDADVSPHEFARWHVSTMLEASYTVKHARNAQSKIAGGCGVDLVLSELSATLVDLAAGSMLSGMDEVSRVTEMGCIARLIIRIESFKEA